MVDSDLMVVADLTVDGKLDDRHKLDRRCKLDKPRSSSSRAFSAVSTATSKSYIGLDYGKLPLRILLRNNLSTT